MNDFDFEELDKAVNQLASKTHDEHGDLDSAPAQASKPVSAVGMPASIAPVSKPEPKPEPAAIPTPATSVEAPAVKSTSVPAKHRLGDTPARRGSFMDIVPPAPRKSPTRVGVSVQPVSKAEEITPEAPAKAEPEPINAPASKPEVEPKPAPELTAEPHLERTEIQPRPDASVAAEVGKESTDVAWPDPLDFNDDKPVTSTVSAESTEPVSPFLAEAKVEKRPLGAFSNFKATEEPKQPEANEELAKPEPQVVQDELTPETDGTFKEPEKAPLPPKEGEKPEEKESAKPDLHGAAMMSIPDQYRPEPKATDKTPRPVYDTKEYHPPLIEATSHEHRGGGSMWGKIFIAFVVLALIAVGGYFAYIYFVQQL